MKYVIDKSNIFKFKIYKDNQLIPKILYRIRAIRDFANVKAGDFGGWIKKGKNLSQNGNCWIYGNAWVYDNARVYGFTIVRDNSRVFGNARVSNMAKIEENDRICGNLVIKRNNID